MRTRPFTLAALTLSLLVRPAASLGAPETRSVSLHGAPGTATNGLAIARDPDGNRYVTGWTNAADLPSSSGAFQRVRSGGASDAFVAKLDKDGAIVWLTYLGGRGGDIAHAIAVDDSRDVIVAGETTSSDFPTVNGAQRSYGGGLRDAFVTKLSADGGSLLWSTYLGGAADELATGVAVDRAGSVYVTGPTSSAGFPVTPGAFQTRLGGKSDAFVVKLNASGQLGYSTFLGGSGAEDMGAAGATGGIAVDASGAAIVTGGTSSTDFPVKNAFQPKLGGFEDVFVSKLAPAGDALVYSTYVGGASYDDATAIAVDASGRAFVTGGTTSFDFPITPNAHQKELGRASHADAFLTRIEPDGRLSLSTYHGGSDLEIARSIALGPNGSATIVGRSLSADLPLVDALQSSSAGGLFHRLDGSAAFTRANKGLALSTVNALVLHPKTGEIYAAIPEDGLAVSKDGGRSWSRRDLHMDGRALAITPDFRILVGGVGGVRMSSDGGYTFVDLSTGLPSGTPVTTLAATATTLFAGFQGPGLYRMNENSAAWEGLASSEHFSKLFTDQFRKDVYAATDHGIYKSVNGGPFSPSSAGLPANLPITSIAQSPRDPNVLYATASNGGIGAICRSNDGGASWKSALGTQFGLNTVAVDTAGVVYAGAARGSGYGVLRGTEQAGGSAVWEAIGLENAHVVDILDAGAQGLFVATAGGADAFEATFAEDGSLTQSSSLGTLGDDDGLAVAVGVDAASYPGSGPVPADVIVAAFGQLAASPQPLKDPALCDLSRSALVIQIGGQSAPAQLLPRIDAVSPPVGLAGQLISVTGANFEDAAVTINGATASILASSGKLLLIQVPDSAPVNLENGRAALAAPPPSALGVLVVKTPKGSASTPFTVAKSGADLELRVQKIVTPIRSRLEWVFLVRNTGTMTAHHLTIAYQVSNQGTYGSDGEFDCPTTPAAGRCYLESLAPGAEARQHVLFWPVGANHQFGLVSMVKGDEPDPNPLNNTPGTVGFDLDGPPPPVIEDWYPPEGAPGVPVTFTLSWYSHCCPVWWQSHRQPLVESADSSKPISVTFGGVPAKVVSVHGEKLVAVVPPGAKDGPIEVTTPLGTIVSAKPFKVSDGSSGEVTQFVPIVLSSSGLNGSFFTTELTLTNRGELAVKLAFTYTAAFGGGSGTATLELPPRAQLVLPDAIELLGALGVPIPATGNRGGTLSVKASGFESGDDVAVTARTTTAVEGGRAGLAYGGVPTTSALRATSYLYGLRQNEKDRSNVALQNAGRASDGSITLRLTVFSGDPANPITKVLPDVVLEPGGFTQISGILASNGLSLSNGYVRVERVAGTAAYAAYAVINDQPTSDGSLVSPVLESSGAGAAGLTLPAVVEAGAFTSELTVTNRSAARKTVRLTFVTTSIAGGSASIDLSLEPGEQQILPRFVQLLRDRGATIGPAGLAYAGALFASVPGGDVSGLFLGVRVAAAAAQGPAERSALAGASSGGEYGVFYSAVPYGSASTREAWVYGLRQDEENRSNLGLVNTGEVDGSRDVFTIELYDGDTRRLVATIADVGLDARAWTQIGTILAKYAPGTRQGYAHVVRTSGGNPFVVYGIVNDGKKPGDRTGDGAYIASAP